MSTEEQTQQQPVEEGMPNLPQLLRGHPSAPTVGQIEQWKAQYGEVFVSGFTPEELFVWRPLSRREFTDLSKAAKAPVNPEEEQKAEDNEEKVVKLCVLWAAKPTILEYKGGSVTTLHEQIMLNSNFMAPSIAATLVAKL